MYRELLRVKDIRATRAIGPRYPVLWDHKTGIMLVLPVRGVLVRVLKDPVVTQAKGPRGRVPAQVLDPGQVDLDEDRIWRLLLLYRKVKDRQKRLLRRKSPHTSGKKRKWRKNSSRLRKRPLR